MKYNLVSINVASLVVWGEKFLDFLIVVTLPFTFYLSRQELTQKKRMAIIPTYLGIPFLNDLELKIYPTANE